MEVKSMIAVIVISPTKVRTDKGYTFDFHNNLRIGQKIWVSIKKGKVIKHYTASNNDE